MVVLLLMGQWDKKKEKKKIYIITVYMLGLFVVPLGYEDFFWASSCLILLSVLLAHALPSAPPQAKKAWYALDVLSLRLATSSSALSCRANQATMVWMSLGDMGFPDIRALAVNTPFDGFPSSPTMAFFEGTDLERISKPLWALRLTETGGIRLTDMFTPLIICYMI